jgi:diguanylate cyclase (GGDEF)-like protein
MLTQEPGFPSSTTQGIIELESCDDATKTLRKYADLYEFAPVAYLTLDRDRVIRTVNLTGANLLEMERSQLIGRHFEHLVSKETRTNLVSLIERISASQGKGACEVTLQGNGVEPLFVRIEAASCNSGFEYHLAIMDISDSLRSEEALRLVEARYLVDIKQAQENFSFLAHHDPLTKLLNRSTLHTRIKYLLSVAQETKRSVALLILNIDGFKQINSSTSHGVGDKLLLLVAKRLRDCTRTCDVVSRLGRDEFAIILWDSGATESTRVAEKLVSFDFTIEGINLTITTSIGISVYPEDGSDYLLKNADIAMHHAKKFGCGEFKFFTRKLNERAHEQLDIKVGLRLALSRNEFVLYYQPKVNLVTGKLTGNEALIRWQHPAKGLTLPGNFIGIAEESGLLTAISKWTIITACRQIQQWHQQGIGTVSVAVNLSAKFFEHKDFEDTIVTALQETGIAPECLELELTEATLMSNPQKALGNMAAMKALGLKLSIDDFGIGYSSLNYLKKLPIDKLKIDQSFIRKIARDPDDASIVRAIISIGHSMQQKVIAEGVETISQLNWLQNEQCDEVQGFYFSRPLPAKEMTTLLRQGANFLHNPRGKLQSRQS